MIHGLLDQIQACVSDEEDDQPDVDFVFAGLEALGCQTLLICGPGPASAFALQALTLDAVSCKLQPKEGSPFRAFPPVPQSPRFFQASAGVLVALLETSVSGDYAATWADALLSGLPDKTQVLYLDRVLRSEWFSCDRRKPEEPYLAGLWTSSFGGQEGVPALPAPNVVEGLAAALLSGCEARGWPCLVALALQDGAHMSEGCLQGFEALVPLLLEKKVISSWQRPKYHEALQKVVPPAAMSIYA
mmetsp:Transcript_30746/g.57601  ORF Transcript_30746/g.57601 Transcript_30746/m.57601 type:complete len:245 (+) Transcript_30746:43-777(+)